MERREKLGFQPLIDQFCSLSTNIDVARILAIPAQELTFILYVLNGGRENQYLTYQIPKKNGGIRTISAPQGPLKILQKKLNAILQKVYWEKPSAHAFLKDRSIITNARVHAGKRFVLNIDLQDFFPSINFGRVRGLFLAPPYSLDARAATILAQIACQAGALPQGAPTSPIISNMICSKLDAELQKLARFYGCMYTRYADDITFSTNFKRFPSALFNTRTRSVGRPLKRVISANGFEINASKSRLQEKGFRQEVTGLIVNEIVNVKWSYVHDVRAMLHDWEVNGLAKAQARFNDRFYPAPNSYPPPAFKQAIRGKVEFIRKIKSSQKKNPDRPPPTIHLKLIEQFHTNCLRDFGKKVLRTEGKTDWMHILSAMNHLKGAGKLSTVDLAFYKSRDHLFYGDRNLLKFCEKVKKGVVRPFNHKIVCLFDCDSSDIVKRHSGNVTDWTGNVFSLTLNNPTSFKRPASLPIELLYPDSVLRMEVEGRRLYTSDEFNASKRLKSDDNIFFNGTLPPENEQKIIDSEVYDSRTQLNVALSKARFARAILMAEIVPTTEDLAAFERLLERIAKI